MRMTYYIQYTPSSYTHVIHVYLRMRGTVNWWAGWSILLVVSYRSLLRVGHRVATLLDSTRESILALRYNFWRLQGTQSCRGKPVLIMHIGFFACFHAISLERRRFSKKESNATHSMEYCFHFHSTLLLELEIQLEL